MAREAIQVVGLRDTQRALRAVDPAAARALRVALNQASTFLIDKVRPQIPSRSGRARSSLKARSSQTAVRIAAGGSRAPYYPWLEWGGAVGIGDSVKRPYLPDGRWLYPTLAQHREEFLRIMDDAVTGVLRETGLDTT